MIQEREQADEISWESDEPSAMRLRRMAVGPAALFLRSKTTPDTHQNRYLLVDMLPLTAMHMQSMSVAHLKSRSERGKLFSQTVGLIVGQ